MKRFNSIIASMFCAGILLGSCAEDKIVIGSVDESEYDNVKELNGYVRDANTFKATNTLELRKNDLGTEVVFGLSRATEEAVEVQFAVNQEYTAEYASEKGDSYEALPESLISLADGGKVQVAPGEKLSGKLALTFKADSNLKEDVTYVAVVSAEAESEGVNTPEKHCIYLISSRSSESDTYKGDDVVNTFLFFEVNDTNPLNALEFKLKDSGKLFFDYVVLFAANINYSAEEGRVYVSCNPNVQYLLDHNEEMLQPLRKRGIKVLMGLLGNHDASGLAQLSELGAQQFAKELAAMCKAYNLDGVNFDDEYSDSPDLSNPLFDRKSTEAAMRLAYWTKQAMPEKLVTLFDYGYMYGDHSFYGSVPGDYVDIVVPNYGGAAEPVSGMTRKNCAGMAVELRRWPSASVSEAKSLIEDGYGYCMLFALEPREYESQISPCNNICLGLYDQELAPVEYFYKKDDTTRYPISELANY